MSKKAPLLLCFLAIGSLSACSPVTSQHGNFVQDYQIEEVQVGQSTRSDVLRILGSPTTQSTFNPDVWYYLGQKTEKRGILDAQITDERVLVVQFDQSGIVSGLAPFEGEREEIPYTRSKTPTHGNELTFMQQLLGNMGRFNTPQSVTATDY